MTAVFADLDGTGESLFITLDGGASVVVIPASWKAVVGAVPPFELSLPSTKFRVRGGSLEGTVATKIHGGVFVADLDGDGEREVIVSAGGQGEAAPSTLFYGNGQPSDWLDLKLHTLSPLDNPDLQSARLLGVGHFDTAPEAGYVTTAGVFEYGAFGYVPTSSQLNLFDWTSAAVADFNADGFDDVAAVSNEPGVDLFLGGKSAVSSAHLSSETGLRNVISGDFDGDGSIDLVATAVSPGSCDKKQAIVGYYGQSLGLPEGPFELGAAPKITSIAKFHFSGDSVDDLFLQFSQATESGDCDKTTLSATGLFGTTDRRLISPFLLPLHGVTNVDPGGYALPARATLADLDGVAPFDIVTTALAYRSEPAQDSFLHLFLFGLDEQPSGDLAESLYVDLGIRTQAAFLATPKAGRPSPGASPSILVFEPLAGVGPLVARAERVEVDGTIANVDFGADATIVDAVDDATGVLSTKVVATDVDHDGSEDFVAMIEIPVEAQTAVEGQPSVTQKACFVLLADPSAPAGLRAKRLSIPDDQPVVDLALVHDSAGVEHLLVATGSGLYLVDADTVRLLHEEAVAPGHEPRIQSVATGDITGDGLEDIVLVLATKTILLSRMAANEKGDPEFSLEL